ncbi:circadian clock KaiB family protein [Methylobacter psychrophilus]|uniref:circadian clock KaiB family protein n=1 Tax=Methylobacter psychrophilus TaxID=96941 RepID=UPI0021D489E0|nr:circadian clock KaiB family protein [Methylobacter psychrophilus]
MRKKTGTEATPIQTATAAFELALTKTEQRHYVLRLYVAGMTANSQRAIDNVQKLCREHLQGRFELEIIDIYQQPCFAKERQIVAVPTLVKEFPLPLRRFIGDMSHSERILAGLDL